MRAIDSGQKTQYAYFDNLGDQRLKQIKNLDPASAVISQFDYTYNAVGNILAWTQANSGSGNPKRYDLGYDSADQLRSANLTDTVTGAGVNQYNYDYDPAGNRTNQQIGNAITASIANNLNQLTSQTSGGKMHFRGTVNEPATVTVGGNPATVDAAGNFDGTVNVNVGSNTVAVIATDASGNTRTNNYQVNVPSGVSTTLLYDLNGNLTSDGPETYEWDAVNRLTAINNGTHRSEFTYNGLSQRTKIVEKDNGSVTSTKQFVWCLLDTQPSEQRDADNSVTKRFFAQGEQISGDSYYYSRDHLGSVRELTDNAAAVRARYAYDPYGVRAKLSGDLEADFGFTGFYFHNPSNLTFSRTRAYDSTSGKWISRDPIAEFGGINLYRYVLNSAINGIDPLGLVNWGQVGAGVLGIVGGIAATAALIAVTPTGIGAVLAPKLALEAAAGYSYGIGNIIAGFGDNPSNHTEAQRMLHSPANLGGVGGRCLGALRGDEDGGQRAQDIGSLGDNLINWGAGFGLSPSGVGLGESTIWLGGQVSSGTGAVQDSINLVAPSPAPTASPHR